MVQLMEYKHIWDIFNLLYVQFLNISPVESSSDIS